MSQNIDEKYEGQDDGEYHFSDDQVNYDVEPEVKTALPANDGTAALKKPAIGIGVFFVLIFLVYKILTPASTTPPIAEFTNAAAPAKGTMTDAAPGTKKSENMVASNEPAPPVVIVPETPVAPTPAPAPVVNAAPSPELVAKISALEEQGAKMQNDLVQKMTEMTAQNTALQGKIQDLTMRLSSMETSLTRLSQNMQELKNKPPASVAVDPFSNNAQAPQQAQEGATSTLAPAAPVVAKPAAPKANYSVQAIIPGRAWLKSENGETVTVAEGDSIKDFGRVVKIDPYDGLVDIDMGGKVVSLSYGTGGE